MTVYPVASQANIAATQAALGGSPIGTDTATLLTQAVILAALLIA